eukprot:12765-Heterococcus_DN1.PRE.6
MHRLLLPTNHSYVKAWHFSYTVAALRNNNGEYINHQPSVSSDADHEGVEGAAQRRSISVTDASALCCVIYIIISGSLCLICRALRLILAVFVGSAYTPVCIHWCEAAVHASCTKHINWQHLQCYQYHATDTAESLTCETGAQCTQMLLRLSAPAAVLVTQRAVLALVVVLCRICCASTAVHVRLCSLELQLEASQPIAD